MDATEWLILNSELRALIGKYHDIADWLLRELGQAR